MKKRLCPECGKWVEVDGQFCPFCGAELPKMDADEPIIDEEPAIEEEPVIDEETGTETFDHERGEAQEPAGAIDLSELPPVPPSRPTPPPFQEKPFYVRHGKAIAGIILALIVVIAGAIGMHFYGLHQDDYTKDAVALSQQLTTENESVTDAAKLLSQQGQGSGSESLIKTLETSRANVEKIAKNYQPQKVPDQYASDDQAIHEVMRNQMALYDKAIAIAKAPTDAAVNDKLNDMLTQSQNAKKIARTIQIPGADFTAAVDDDAAVSYLEKYVAKVKKDEEEKKAKENPDKQILSSYASSKDLFNDDINKLTDDINEYLKDHKDFKGNREFTARANALYVQISKTRSQLESDSSIENVAMKYKLDALLKAEQDRLRGLYDGVSASQNGNDYRPGFQRGQAATDRYDKLNKEWNSL
ncbi:zinc ribbon domain-containing protein [uncultured Megasphaera sp.]|uniref:zinc ribbon domain-containing protein n=1 Tax=uncultured Megasphaera sp. TaxID=165188 RepID=UPI0025CFAC7F|nr:zinc ribbon domain-containing protein [uncultured Megasphaera sp.]